MTPPSTAPEAVTPPVVKTLDSRAVEVLALSVVRTLFRDGVYLPIQMNGLVDMDVVVKDSNVLLNLNSVQAEIPQLAIWRITFAYRGKPVVEYGRGIPNDIKIHVAPLAFLLLALWRERRRKARARARGEATRDQDLLTLTMTGGGAGPETEVRA